MAKRSEVPFTRKVEETVSEITVINLFPAIVKVKGEITGRDYLFNGPGSEVKVDSRDAKKLEEKMTGMGCCGGSPPQHLFQLKVEGG